MRERVCQKLEIMFNIGGIGCGNLPSVGSVSYNRIIMSLRWYNGDEKDRKHFNKENQKFYEKE